MAIDIAGALDDPSQAAAETAFRYPVEIDPAGKDDSSDLERRHVTLFSSTVDSIAGRHGDRQRGVVRHLTNVFARLDKPKVF